ncbi:mirror-image polydactyly gene 1 protein isoform X3 [Girardinichthys multiradiatus]|uniref:mirror-image polydactyly gene 1 protein isoform X3 n=1 Tax=Girardinichthys multiradiatus TaxID=208333 RepID=UPI001FAD8032|nr:mirror-image polydactyly gene 1 protein isoform X3 [Girardinichthys multiradiatus]
MFVCVWRLPWRGVFHVMASSSYSGRSVDVQVALQKAKRKICDLQQQLEEKSFEDPKVISSPSWTSKKELRDSLVDMYRAPCCLQEFPVCCSPSPNCSPVWRTASPVSPSSIKSSLAALPSSFPGGTGEMEADIRPSSDPFSWAESAGDCLDEEAAFKGPNSPVLGRNLVTAGNSSPQISASSPHQTVDQARNISFLLKELDAMRELNNKVQKQMVQKEKELLQKEVDEELNKQHQGVQNWETPTAVLEEMLVAQKDRDQALMSRLLLANEERDEALLRARRLQQAAESDDFSIQDTDMDVKNLLQHVCEAKSVLEVKQFGTALVQHLRLAQQRRNDITAQEMKAVMEERDKSVDKCKWLKENLLQQKDQSVSQEELLRLQNERDAALDKRQRLEAEIQALQANHSCQGYVTPSQPSLSAESSADQEDLSSQVQTLMVQLQHLSRERETTEAELQRSQEAEKEASERVHRLERLVEVLRKKVGAGSLRSVI